MNLQNRSLLVTYCQRQVNGILESARRVKIREFDSFSRCKSRGGGYRLSHGSTLKMTSRTRLYGVHICYGKISSRQS
jgi:hypothetical protein